MARRLGRRGGRRRAERLSEDEKRRIASLGGRARAASLLAAQRISDNFLHLADVRALRGDSIRVERMNTFSHRLPGLYVTRPPRRAPSGTTT